MTAREPHIARPLRAAIACGAYPTPAALAGAAQELARMLTSSGEQGGGTADYASASGSVGQGNPPPVLLGPGGDYRYAPDLDGLDGSLWWLLGPRHGWFRRLVVPARHDCAPSGLPEILCDTNTKARAKRS